MKSSVLLITYKRFSTTQKVFNAIKKAKPPKLYFVNNAPSPNADENERIQISQIRELVNSIDWDCNVKTLFRENHLLTMDSITSSIDWFFENEDEGVIFEDDCLPDQSFFNYCDSLLDFYRNDNSIFIISGANVEPNIEFDNSYRFSKYPHIWGWASWSNRWSLYDKHISQWNSNKLRWFINNEFTLKEKFYWATIFNKLKMNKINTWDYQLLFTTWINNLNNIIPRSNMISNIGFGEDANFTNNANDPCANQPVTKTKAPLKHSTSKVKHKSLDTQLALQHFKITFTISFIRYIYSELELFFKKIKGLLD